jgi:hypothetical protein
LKAGAAIIVIFIILTTTIIIIIRVRWEVGVEETGPSHGWCLHAKEGWMLQVRCGCGVEKRKTETLRKADGNRPLLTMMNPSDTTQCQAGGPGAPGNKEVATLAKQGGKMGRMPEFQILVGTRDEKHGA